MKLGSCMKPVLRYSVKILGKFPLKYIEAERYFIVAIAIRLDLVALLRRAIFKKLNYINWLSVKHFS